MILFYCLICEVSYWLIDSIERKNVLGRKYYTLHIICDEKIVFILYTIVPLFVIWKSITFLLRISKTFCTLQAAISGGGSLPSHVDKFFEVWFFSFLLFSSRNFLFGYLLMYFFKILYRLLVWICRMDMV